MDYVQQNGNIYLKCTCPGCGQELLFKVHDEERRIYAACAKCFHQVEAWVPEKKKIKKEDIEIR